MSDIKRVGWKARDLVGPNTVPKLTDLEDNIEDFGQAHRHGFVTDVIGETPQYEADPIIAADVLVSDLSNPNNQTLADHLKDTSIHLSSLTAPADLKFIYGETYLLGNPPILPDFDLGSITESFVAGAGIPPLGSGVTGDIGGTPFYAGANVFLLDFAGSRQIEGQPNAYFQKQAPKCGRVYQATNGYVGGGGTFQQGNLLPEPVKFDYMFFPFRTWFVECSPSGGSAQSVIVKRYRTNPFSGFRFPGNFYLFTDLKSIIGNTWGITPGQDFVYWPNTEPTRESLFPMTAPSFGDFADDPTNPYPAFREAGEKRYVMVQDDFSRFDAARWNGSNPVDLWAQFWANASHPGLDWFDAMCPLYIEDAPSMRVWGEPVGDNQMDICVWSKCGLLIMLPYGYLPLYFADALTMTEVPTNLSDGETLQAVYSTYPMNFARGGSSITLDTARFDVGVERLASPGSSTYGYLYPWTVSLDWLVAGLA